MTPASPVPLSLFLLLLLLLCSLTTPKHISCPYPLTDITNVVPGEYIVLFHPNASRDQPFRSERKHRVLHHYTHDGLKGRAIRTAFVEDLLQHESVSHVECNHKVRADKGPCPWGVDRVTQESLPIQGHCHLYSAAKGVLIYVLDTGVRASHVEFSGRVERGRNFLSEGGPEDTADLDRHGGHGTLVAGVVAGKKYGVARAATVHPVRVLGKDREGTLADVIAGLDYITNRGVAPAIAVLSFGSQFSRSLNAAVKNVFHQGVIVVTSAGNDSKDACTKSPASSPYAITVGSLNVTDLILPSSNYGPCVSMYAPGENIRAPSSKDNEELFTFSGTSAAAPHVAGVAALLMKALPPMPPQQFRDVLETRYTNEIHCDCIPSRIVYTNGL